GETTSTPRRRFMSTGCLSGPGVLLGLGCLPSLQCFYLAEHVGAQVVRAGDAVRRTRSAVVAPEVVVDADHAVWRLRLVRHAAKRSRCICSFSFSGHCGACAPASIRRIPPGARSAGSWVTVTTLTAVGPVAALSM